MRAVWSVLLVGCAAPPFELGQSELEMVSLTEVDPTRVTPEVAGGPAETPERTLEVVVWLGAWSGEGADARPLLLMAHGGSGSPEKFDAIARDAAAAGFVPAAIRFPLTSDFSGAPVPSAILDLADQPRDLSVVLDRLLEEVAVPGGPLDRRFDPEQIVLLGHSLGAQTAIALTRYDGDRDDRIDLAIVASPFTMFNDMLWPDDPLPVTGDGPPTVLIHGQDDPTANYTWGEEVYASLTGPRWFVGLADVAHAEMLESQEVPAIDARRFAQDVVFSAIRSEILGEAVALDAALDRMADAGHVVRRDP